MSVPEFTDTYSDDLIYLEKALPVLLARDDIESYFCIPSLCRIYLTFMVQGIEYIMKQWTADTESDVLSTYFIEKNSNEARCKSLISSLTGAGIDCDQDIVKDFLALKYLRNIIAHAGSTYRVEQSKWISSRGFPTDTRHFKKEHWDRIVGIKDKMLIYAVQATLLYKRRIVPPS